MELVQFQEIHLEQAANLFSRSYKLERELSSSLPVRYEDRNNILPFLQNSCKKATGIVAIENNNVMGYLVGTPVSCFKGTQRGIFCPEWSHAAIGENRIAVYKKMYEKMASIWVENGCLTHGITILSHDNEAIDTWFRNGFGMHVINAVRPLDSFSDNINDEIEIRQIEMKDINNVLSLLHNLNRHMASSPIFLPLTERIDARSIMEWLSNENNTIWLGISKGQIISFIKVKKKASNDADILSDEGTISVGGYTSEDYRGKEITKNMLQKIIEYYRNNGYQRCAVVFESQNISGSQFWLKYFKPVCYSLVRKIDDRIFWANKNRDIQNMW